MASPRAQTLMGRIAVRANLITMDQLAEATREQGSLSNTRNIGDILVDKGFLTPEELSRLVELQKRIVERAREKEEARRRDLARPAWDIEDESDDIAMHDDLPARRHPETTPLSVARLPEIPDDPPTLTPATLTEQTQTVEAARAAVQQALASTPIAMNGLDDVLHSAVEASASDVHIHAGAPIRLRVRGELVEFGSEPLDAETAESLVLSSLTPEERELFAERGELDFCYTLPELGRFRANVYRQLRGVDGVYRHIPARVPLPEEIGLPTSLAKFTNFHQGMVLITGPTSCGKSTTMAALVNLINEERSEHILLIEDPIEYLHESKRCLVNQRNVHRHTQSFARALRGALREDPDVIVIGELRDRETISLALTAAETGHFVLATLHTDSSIRTVDRLVGAFPPNQQNQVRAMVSESLRAVISQRLVTNKARTAQIPALEILIINKAVGKLIRDNKTFQLPSVLQTGSAHGMCLLDNALADLVDSEVITRDEALRHCAEPKRFAE